MGESTTGMTARIAVLQLWKAGREKEGSFENSGQSTSPLGGTRLWRDQSRLERVTHGSPQGDRAHSVKLLMADGDSFLPRVQSVFYAVFDNDQGPKIVYQVPEGLIAVPTDISSSQHLLPPPTTIAGSSSPRKRPSTTNNVLFDFDEISKYGIPFSVHIFLTIDHLSLVIPQSPLCGRLVTCPTREHRVMGFPVELRGDYTRNYLRYNVCFVFNRAADLSCYESVVRKVSRVLTACEVQSNNMSRLILSRIPSHQEESGFLSNPKTSTQIYAILEQLYEDLNSYSETSIQIDQFNSIQLKILPFYPNPPQVHDWQVSQPTPLRF